MKAIDLSAWNGDVDFNKVKQYGIDTVIIRAGFGREKSQKDTRFEEYYAGAIAAGLNIGAYWYSYADSVQDALTEAETCLYCLGGKSFDLPIYFDMEEPWQTQFGRAKLTTMALAFGDTIEESGYRAGIYSNVNWFSNFLNYAELAAKYSIWLAQWGVSTCSYACDIWQYGDDGRVPGISGAVDMNEIINPSVINGGGKAVYFDISMPYLAKSGYINTGEEVKTVQRLLNSMDYRDSNGYRLVVDGIFGDCTDQAVRGFQKAKELEADGIVGKDTWKALTGGK